MLNAYASANLIVDQVNKYTEEFVAFDGRVVNTTESVAALDDIVKRGATLCKYLVENQLYVGKPEIESAINGVNQYLEKLSNENAKKLQLDSAMQLWQQLKVAVAHLACAVLDHKDKVN